MSGPAPLYPAAVAVDPLPFNTMQHRATLAVDCKATIVLGVASISKCILCARVTGSRTCSKVALDMGEPYASALELISFHTVSKGVYGECGLRGGYFETLNIHPETVAELYKMASINLCPNTIGQIMIGLMTKEPKAGAESFASHEAEKAELLASLRRKAHMMTDFFNGLNGVSCNFTEGAMYSFPAITCVVTPSCAPCEPICKPFRSRCQPPRAPHGMQAASQGGASGRRGGQSAGCVLLPQASGGDGHFDCAGFRFRAAGRHVPLAHDNPAIGRRHARDPVQVALLPPSFHGRVQLNTKLAAPWLSLCTPQWLHSEDLQCTLLLCNSYIHEHCAKFQNLKQSHPHTRDTQRDAQLHASTWRSAFDLTRVPVQPQRYEAAPVDSRSVPFEHTGRIGSRAKSENLISRHVKVVRVARCGRDADVAAVKLQLVHCGQQPGSSCVGHRACCCWFVCHAYSCGILRWRCLHLPRPLHRKWRSLAVASVVLRQPTCSPTQQLQPSLSLRHPTSSEAA